MAKNRFKPMRIPTPRNVFLWAEAYAEAADKLAAEQLTSKPARKYTAPGGAHAAPTATLDVFALELYLKCLILDDNRQWGDWGDGHAIDILFSKLKEGTQKVIQIQYNALMQLNSEYIRQIHKSRPNVQVLENTLAQSSGVFKRIRYLFEGLSEPLFYSPLLRIAAWETIILSKPRWPRRKSLSPIESTFPSQ